MRILVTGGAGYIGSIITEELVRQNHAVTVLDNLSKGHRSAVDPAAKLIEGDLLDRVLVKEILIQHQIEAVIHMAASSLVGESMHQPREYFRNNFEASIYLLNAMCDCGVKQIVFSSTAAVYGEPGKQPIEETDLTQPTNPYGESKLAVENVFKWYNRAYGLKFTSLRYFNAAGASNNYGESHDPESHLIPNILHVALGKNQSLELFGDDYPTSDGTCVRDYIHVIDLARAHILALAPEVKDSFIFNLGCGGKGYSVSEVVETARKVTGHPIPVHIAKRRPGDPSTLIASSSRIQGKLGWKPEFQDLELIIESAWKWMLAHPNGYQS